MVINQTTLDNLEADAATLDTFSNSVSTTVTPRTGASYNTLRGHLIDMGYKVPVAYTSGLNITLTTETVDEAGVIYAPKPSSLPISSTPASFVAADWYPIQLAVERTLLSTFTDFADAVSTVGADGTIIIDQDETLGAFTYTVPTGVTIITKATFELTLVGGTTLNVNGIVQGIDPWIDATVGTVVFDNQDVDIRWFGAVDGSNSDMAINTAINAADTNNLSVFIPEGIWKLAATLTGKDSVRLFGKSFDLSIIQANANITTMLTLPATDMVTVDNLQFDVDGNTVSQIILNKGDSNTFHNLKCQNTSGTAGGDNVLAASVIGIEVDGTATDLTKTLIEDCEFFDIGAGVKINNGPKNVTVRRNRFSLFGLAGILGTSQIRDTDEVRINQNHFSDPLGGGVIAKYAISLQALANNYNDVECSKNMIIGNDVEHRVPTTLLSTDPSSFPAASKNEYVFFTSPATVDTQSVLAGENWICITATVGGDKADWQLTGKSMADGLEFETIDGLIVEGNYVFGTGGSGIALRDDCGNAIVNTNLVYSCDVNGIEVGTGSTTGNDVLVTNNLIHNCARDQGANYTTHGGIFLKDLDDSVVIDNKISCDIVSSEQMPYAIVIEDCLLLTENNQAAGWAANRVIESGTNTFTSEQVGIATSGDINWDAGSGFEVTLADGTGVLKLPTGIRPGSEVTLRFFSGNALDITAFTAIGGMYNPVVAVGTLNTAKVSFDDAGVGYIRWDNGIIPLSNSQRGAASDQANGAMYFNTNQNEPNINDDGTWRNMTGGTS